MKVEVVLEDVKCCKGCPLLDWFQRDHYGTYGCLAGFELTGSPENDENVVRPMECIAKNGE